MTAGAPHTGAGGRLIDATRVMAWLAAALYFETGVAHADVDGRDKPGHDGTGAFLESILAS